jgi:hypothetical protein
MGSIGGKMPNGFYRQVAIRAFYFYLARALDLALILALDLALDIDIALDFALTN